MGRGAHVTSRDVFGWNNYSGDGALRVGVGVDVVAVMLIVLVVLVVFIKYVCVLLRL